MYLLFYKTEEWSEDHEPFGQIKTFSNEKAAFLCVAEMIAKVFEESEFSEDEEVKVIMRHLKNKDYFQASQTLESLQNCLQAKEVRKEITDNLDSQYKTWSSNSENSVAIEEAIRDFNNLNLESLYHISVVWAPDVGTHESLS